MSDLSAEIEQHRSELAKLKTKLREYQDEVDQMEQRRAALQEQVDDMKAYLATLDREDRRMAVHLKVIEEQRLHLISLADFLSDEEAVSEPLVLRNWKALAEMHGEARRAIHQFTHSEDEVRS